MIRKLFAFGTLQLDLLGLLDFHKSNIRFLEIVASNFISDVRSAHHQLHPPYSYFDDESASVFETEVLHPTDVRAIFPEMAEAKHQELRNLLFRGTFQVISKEDILSDANVLPGRFLQSVKSSLDGRTKHKARYVLGRHRDKLKAFMVHSTSTVQPQSVLLPLALATLSDFNIWTVSIPQAYLQAAEPLGRCGASPFIFCYFSIIYLWLDQPH